MKPVNFEKQNAVYAENQPQYNPLPAYKANDGCVLSCWSLTIRERLYLLFTGKIWLQVMTFNHLLQPLFLSVKKPVMEIDAENL
jgi:hypothetical protein